MSHTYATHILDTYMRHAYDYHILANAMENGPVLVPNIVVEVVLAHGGTQAHKPANHDCITPCLTHASIEHV